MSARKNREPQFVELNIDSVAFEGFGVARKDNIVHFIKGGLPGDKIIARVGKKKKRYVEGRLEEILEPSPHRISAPCPHFGLCGGCSWQDLDYSQQLLWKKRHVEDAFRHIAKIEAGEIKDTMPSRKVFNYRNKMEFSFAPYRWLTVEEIADESAEVGQKDFALGLHVPGNYSKVLEIDSCQIQIPIGNDILSATRRAALDLGVQAYNVVTHEGFLRNLIIRSSESTGEIMVILVTDKYKQPEDESMVRWFETEFIAAFPQLSDVIHAVNTSFSPVSTGDCRIIKGRGYITENILGIDYRISPFSFFQTNSSQLNPFIADIIEYAQLKPTDTVWDLYCGTGSITLPASRKAGEIYGLELVESSISDAKHNAESNGIDNAHFLCTDLHSKEMTSVLSDLPRPDVIIVDPPRAGMHKNLVAHILEAEPERIVYVSCNPATQARDVALLSEKYDLVTVQPVDMFPHTFHVESIARLERKEF
jgi:23S rRNA (uracil1939-C5)-methyltransferase